mgnify:CR=1 FL=1
MKIPYTHYSATHHYITTGTPVMRRLVVPAFMSNTLLCSSRYDLYIGTQHKYTYYGLSMQYCTINLYYSTLLLHKLHHSTTTKFHIHYTSVLLQLQLYTLYYSSTTTYTTLQYYYYSTHNISIFRYEINPRQVVAAYMQYSLNSRILEEIIKYRALFHIN